MHILFGINCKTNTHKNSKKKTQNHSLNLLLDAFDRKCTYLVWEPTNLAATGLNSFSKLFFFVSSVGLNLNTFRYFKQEAATESSEGNIL